MRKFPSIESFAHVYRDAVNGLTVRPKIKLHGTNGGIRVENGKAIAQSRNNVLIDTDNAGFAAWVRSQEKHWVNSDLEGAIVFGEWAGPGIQQKDAVTQISERYFFPFAFYYEKADLMITEPDRILMRLDWRLKNVLVLPWEDEAVTINYENAGTEVDRINAKVDQIGESDPYIKRFFGVEGPGEGLVYMPDQACTLEHFCRNTFKAKAEAHRVRASSKAVSTRIDIPKDAVEFVQAFVTPARVQQAITEACGGVRDPKLTGDFLKWICSDIHKEAHVELAAMGYEWGKLAKFVVVEAKKHYLATLPMLEAA